MERLRGKLLEIDLTTERTRLLEIDEEIIGKFIGGRSLGAKLLYDYLTPGADPLGPENKMFVLTGPLTGTIAPNAGKYVVVTKSPATGGFLDSYASGYIAAELKFSGLDGLMITGRAEKPTYLWIKDGKVEFKDASRLWGTNTIEAEEGIKAETDKNAGVMVIGPAGENLVRLASINSDHYRQAGRGGGGAVMGSKNLKGIAVVGSGGVEPYDRETLTRKYLSDLEKLRKSQVGMARKRYGTPMTMNITNKAGMLPVNNFQTCTIPEAIGKIDGEGVEKLTVKTRACWGCMLGCSKITKVQEGPYQDDILEGPEYETAAMLGSNLGITYLPAVIRANILCDTLGMDTMSAGVVIAFLMECFEKGLVTAEEVGIKNPGFGNYEAALELLEMMAYRKGFGDLLAEGVKRVADKIAQGSYQFAMHVKGLEFPAYEPRAAWGACLAYAVSPRGACHRRAWPPAYEVLGGVPPFTTENKARLIKNLYDDNGILHSILVCDFPNKFIPLGIKDYAQYINAVTGLSVTAGDLRQMTERGETMIRMFNNREGFSRDDDTLPDRVFSEPLADGPAKGQMFSREALDTMLDEYYALRGWDRQGRPLAETLTRLGLE